MHVDLRTVLLSSGLSIIIYMLSIYFPVFGGFVSFFSPLPLGYVRLKDKKIETYLALLIAIIFLFAIYGFSGAFLYLFQYVVPLLLFIEIYLKSLNFFSSLTISCLFLIFCFYLSFGMYFSFDFSTLNNKLIQYLNKSLNITLKSYFSNLSKAELIEINSKIKSLLKFFVKILPSIMFIFHSAVMVGNFYILKRITEKFKTIDLTKWRLPFFIVWIFIVSGFLMFLFRKNFIYTISINFFIVSCFLFLIQGLCIVEFWFNKINASPVMRGLFLFTLFFFQILFIFIAILGLFDSWFDFRKLNKEVNK